MNKYQFPSDTPAYRRAKYLQNRDAILARMKAPAARAKQAEWRKNNLERVRESERRSRERHRDERSARAKAARQTPKGKAARQRIERLANLAQYGLNDAGYAALLKAQGGRCRVCRSDTPGGHGNVFQVDHCHRSKVVRGLLCTRCNTALGLLRDDPAICFAAARYLLSHQVVAEIA